MERNADSWSITETNGAEVEALAGNAGWRLRVPAGAKQYTNAQIDDYSGGNGATFRWGPGTSLALEARFSSGVGNLVGTAGFGFWNAPFGPGAGYGIRLPQASWFFFASAASDLPLAPGDEKGNGWFASTIDAGKRGAWLRAPLTLPVLILNQFSMLRRMLWSSVRRSLAISYEAVAVELTAWHEYRMFWRGRNVTCLVDGAPVLTSPRRPRGPLGFVAWIDNQHMTMTPRGRLGWGVEPVREAQWLEIRNIRLDRQR